MDNINTFLYPFLFCRNTHGTSWPVKVSAGKERRGVAVAEWESEDPGFEPRRLQATFDPRLPKKPTK